MISSYSTPKILLVDDDKDIRRIYANYLSVEGFEVFEASSGEEALLQFSDKKIDIILLDIRMPGTTGSALIPALGHRYPDARIIVSSCYAVFLQKEMIQDAADYFDKSAGCRALLSKIRSVLQIPSVPSETSLK